MSSRSFINANFCYKYKKIRTRTDVKFNFNCNNSPADTLFFRHIGRITYILMFSVVVVVVVTVSVFVVDL